MRYFTAAVKHAVGGETAGQNVLVEATIKKWFRSQEDGLKAERKRALEKAQEERAAAAGLPPLPAMELSVADAQRLGAGDSATK